MSSLFYRVFRQAKQTFDARNHENFSHSFNQLKQLVNQVTITDLNINPMLASHSAFEIEDKAPCTFVNIYDSDEFTMTVFILKENYTMPLHDHPEMYGLLRVISGNIRINSYTRSPTEIDVSVKAEPVKNLSIETEAATLTPTKNNYHEITAVGGPAAFFDILSPPYDFDHPIFGKRKCSFYQKTYASKGDNLILEKIPSPESYYCDTATYYAPDFLFE
jgi:cysteamine dioxygenase